MSYCQNFWKFLFFEKTACNPASGVVVYNLSPMREQNTAAHESRNACFEKELEKKFKILVDKLLKK